MKSLLRSLKIIFFSFLIIGSPFLAQEEPFEPSRFESELPAIVETSTPMTLAQIVELALSHHPSTKRSWWQLEWAKAQLGSSKSAYYPELHLQAQTARGKDFEYIHGPGVSYNAAGADLVLSMLLYDFGQREADVRFASYSLKAARWQNDWITQKVIIDVLEVAYQSLHREELVECAKISFKDAEHMLTVAKNLNHAGLVSIGDLYLAEATLAQMQIQLFEEESKRDIQQAKLAMKMGLDPQSSIKLEPLEKHQAPQKKQVDTLLSLGLQNRADLLAQKARAAASEAQSEKAKRAHCPTLALDAMGGAQHDVSTSGQYRAAIRLDIPLFDGFRTTYNQQSAYAQARIADVDTYALQEEISLNILSQVSEIQALEKMLPSSEKRLLACNQSYASVQERYSAGRVSISELSMSLQQLAGARIRHSEMKIRWMVALSQLAYVTGTLSPQISFKDTPEL